MISRGIRKAVLALLSAAVACRAGALGAAETNVEPYTLPFAADAFELKRSADGSLHAVYARGGKVYYRHRPAGKEAFAEALPVDAQGAPFQSGGHQHSPRLAFGKGRLYVLWQTKKGMHFTASADGGRTWKEAPVRDAGVPGEIDMPALASGPDGAAYVVWVDERGGHPADDRYASDLYLAKSADGRRFAKNVRLTGSAPLACPCCRPALAVDSRGRLWIAYRSSEANLKDTQLLIVTSRGVEAKRLSAHRWRFEGCPMDGPSLAVRGDQAAVVWTSDGDMFAASSLDGGATFSAPERLGKGAFHAAAAGPGGVVLAWDEGPETGWRRLGGGNGPRLPVRPEGALLAWGDAFRLVAPGRPHHTRPR